MASRPISAGPRVPPLSSPMWRTAAIYAVALAAGAFVLEWLEYKYVTRVFATEFYILILALGFTALGIWAGYRLTPKTAPAGFERNDAAIKSLGVTDREIAVLEQLVAGRSNKEIARLLDVSPNTVKTHISHLFEKLEVERRTQAIQKARELRIVP
jgi:DNA-binding CsgD family transcriptional regulator